MNPKLILSCPHQVLFMVWKALIPILYLRSFRSDHPCACRDVATAIMWLLMLGNGIGESFCEESEQANWPRFRGPNGQGLAAGKIPLKWTQDKFAWKTKLPGSGNSSPVTWGKRVFVTSANSDTATFSLTCLDLDSGNLRWSQESPCTQYRKHKNNSYASSTPAVDEHHVYILRQMPEHSPVTAWTHAGEKVWEVDLGPYRHGQGGATSPILSGDLVIISNDHGKGSCLIALDRRTGSEKWRLARQGKRACYSTPCVLHLKDGRKQLVFTHCFEGIIGVDPKLGTIEWHLDVFGDFPQRAVGSPVVSQGLIFANSGAASGERNLVAIRTDGKHVSEAYRIKRGAPHVPTSIIRDGLVFSWADNGIVTCLKASTGDVVWSKRVGGNFFASPICIGDRLVCPDLDGRVVILSASEDFELLGRHDLNEECKATPAFAGETLLLRTDSTLWAVKY